MANIEIRLEKVGVTQGQGIGEGAFELRLTLRSGNNMVNWPNATSNASVPVGAQVQVTNQQVEVVAVAPGQILSRAVTIEVLEIDKGLNGEDDFGSGSIDFELREGMPSTLKSVRIGLRRPKMNVKGEVEVFVRAQQL